MTSTISSFRSEVREITRDTSAVSQHTTDAQIDRFVADAFTHLYAVRPDTRYDGDMRLDDVTFPADAGQLASFSVTFDARFRNGIAYYAASRAFECDVNDSVNRELSNLYLQKANAAFAT